MPSISTPDPRHRPEWNTYEATILGLADTTRGSLLSSIDPFPPPKEKRTALRDSIEFGGLALSRLSTLISELQTKVQILQDGYDKLQWSIKLARNSLVPPISTLPDEILAEIMLCCSPNSLPVITSRTRAWFPSALIMVSRKWRELVYSSPRLWSSFHVDFDEYFRSEGDPHVAVISRLVDRHLTRSASTTLTVGLSASYSMYPPVLRNICAHSERWKHLVVSRGTLCHILNEHCSHRLPMLRSLKIWLDNSRTSHPITTFDDAPELRSLTLQGFYPGCLSPHFPWHQLTHLTLYQSDHHAPPLSKVPNLISLSLRYLGYTYRQSSHHGITNYDARYQAAQLCQPLMHLRHLFVTAFSLPIVERLVAPSLEQLYLQGGSICRAAVDLLGRSACSLTELTVVTNQEPHAINQLLAACPSLTVLSIQADDAFINALCILLSDPTIIPHLRSLMLVYVGREAETSSFLRDSAQRTTGPCKPWTPSLSDSQTSSIPSVGRPSQLVPSPVHRLRPGGHPRFIHYSHIFDDTSHVVALSTAIRNRLTTLHSVSISNPITRGIVSALLSFASQGIDARVLIGRLPDEVIPIQADPPYREVQYGQVLLTY